WHSHSIRQSLAYRVFFFDDTASTEIYTLSYTTLFRSQRLAGCCGPGGRRRSATAAAASAAAVGENGVGLHYCGRPPGTDGGQPGDRKSTRLNSSHVASSYAVFCLKKKKRKQAAFRPEV